MNAVPLSPVLSAQLTVVDRPTTQQGLSGLVTAKPGQGIRLSSPPMFTNEAHE